MRPYTAVERIEGASPSFRVVTSRGKVSARNVVIATNAYTDHSAPALSRRVVPVNSFGIATEPLSEDRLNQVLPGKRACV